jgi:ABC-type Na+ efflux pump permease subunit
MTVTTTPPFSLFDNPQLEQRLFGRILKVLLVIIGVLLVLWAVSVYVIGLTSSDPQKVSDRFVDAMTTGNTTQAYQLAAPGLQAHSPISQFTAFDKSTTHQVNGKFTLTYKNFAVGHLYGKRISFYVFIYEASSKTTATKKLYIRTEVSRYDGGRWLVNSVTTTPLLKYSGVKLF